MKALLAGSFALATIIATILIVGWLLPVQHQVSRSVQLHAPIEAVWLLITDFQKAPSWRSDIKSVERVATPTGVLWKEVAADGEVITYETTVVHEGRKLVRRIVGPDLPFGGSWTFELAPDQSGNGCALTITEDGEVYNPIFRVVS